MTTKTDEQRAEQDRQLLLIYQRIWKDAEPQLNGTRVQHVTAPVDMVRQAARDRGINLSRSEAGKITSRLQKWLTLSWKSGKGCRLTCQVDPATLVNNKDHKGGDSAIKTRPSNPPMLAGVTGAATAYCFLYRERGKKDEQGQTYVLNPLRELENKWTNRNAQATFDGILAHADWTEWREVITVGDETIRRLYLLVEPSNARNGDELQHTTTDAPPKPLVVKAGGEDTNAGSPPPTPPNQMPGRRTHGRKGVYVNTLEAAIWKLFLKTTNESQPRGGWDMSNVDSLKLADIRSEIGATESNISEALGRMCAAEILTAVAPNAWKMSWNPQDIHIENRTERKLILLSKESVRKHALAIAEATKLSRDGRIDSLVFQNAVATAWNTTRGRVTMCWLNHKVTLDTASTSQGVLVRDPEGYLRLAPESLAGSDFIPADPKDKRVYNRLIQPDDESYERHRRQLQKRYAEAAAFKGETPSVTPPAEPAASTPPPPTTPQELPAPQVVETSHAAAPPIDDTIGAKLARLKREVTVLLELEQKARTEADELARQAAKRLTEADELANERNKAEVELTTMERQVDELIKLDLDMEKLRTRMAEITAILLKK
jgi:hypothetical protein